MLEYAFPKIDSLEPGDIHAWVARLDRGDRECADLRALLSADEERRAAQFRFDVHRRRFVAARGILRALLSRYLHDLPERVRFEYEKYGKPRLPDLRPHFNLAHSEDRALIAISSSTALGVDLEHVRPMRDSQQIAARFFSSSEAAELAATPPDCQTRAFFRCWTRKEAFVKAIGDGLSYPLDGFSVSLDLPARLIHIDGDLDAPAQWMLHHIEPEEDYIGTIAIAQNPTRLLLFHFPPPL